MTVLDQITEEVKGLSAKQQQEALKLLRSMRASSGQKIIGAKSSVKTRSMWNRAKREKRSKRSKAEISAAVRGIAGMWKDRTDLPKDPVLAVKVLRERMRSRGRNA